MQPTQKQHLPRYVSISILIVFSAVAAFCVYAYFKPTRDVAVSHVVPDTTIAESDTPQTRCYTRTQLATAEAPYSSEEHVQITIDGTTVTGTKAGTQEGPGVSNGFWGDLEGTLTGTAMELVYSYTVEGSEGKELELYEVSESALTKLRYVLTEQGDMLVPDRTGEPTRLVYTLEPCTE